jgi:rubrerythrin
MTESALKEAYAGESQAHMRYEIFADVAEKAGLKNTARQFRAIAFAEKIHATNHYRALGMIRDSSQNLQVAIDGEAYEVEEMYPVFNQTAKFQNEKGAELSTHYALETEKVHLQMYKETKKAVDEKKDIELGDVYICSVCGYTMVGKQPEKCPVCNAPGSAFVKF